jgi:hypothetical protein
MHDLVPIGALPGKPLEKRKFRKLLAGNGIYYFSTPKMFRAALRRTRLSAVQMAKSEKINVTATIKWKEAEKKKVRTSLDRWNAILEKEKGITTDFSKVTRLLWRDIDDKLTRGIPIAWPPEVARAPKERKRRTQKQ